MCVFHSAEHYKTRALHGAIKVNQVVSQTNAYCQVTWKQVYKLFAIGGLFTIAMALISIKWLDLPLATWIHAQGLDKHLWMRTLLDTPIVAAPVAILYVLVYVTCRRWSAPSRGERDWLMICVALLVSLEIKSVLKLTFGRTWPREVMNFALANKDGTKARAYDCVASHGYLNDGIHFFNFFHGADKEYSAFPSGSTVSLLAMVIPIMAIYPRTRWPLGLFSVTSLCFFLLTNTHYLGDVIAGVYVGLLCGFAAVVMRNEDVGLRG
jgi:hypothetical protein